VEPRVLLLDEPFGALDAKVRQELRRWLRRLHDEIHLTSLFVTHDQEEALELAGRVVIMDHGQIEQQGSPEDVFERPATPFVMNFLGHVNIFHGRVESGKALLGPLAIDYPEHTDPTPQPAAGYTRPYELDLSRTELSGGLWAVVAAVTYGGSVARIELSDSDGRSIQVELSRERYLELNPVVGERFYVTPRNVRVFLTDRA
jgi:sulfate transport system ATP-binding protein